jgi:hypothetical protein
VVAGVLVDRPAVARARGEAALERAEAVAGQLAGQRLMERDERAAVERRRLVAHDRQRLPEGVGGLAQRDAVVGVRLHLHEVAQPHVADERRAPLEQARGQVARHDHGFRSTSTPMPIQPRSDLRSFCRSLSSPVSL